jgi:hypothetical protein
MATSKADVLILCAFALFGLGVTFALHLLAGVESTDSAVLLASTGF